MANFNKQSRVAVVMVPLPAQGHLNPLLLLARRLVSAADLPVFYVGTATLLRQAKIRAQDLISGVHFHELPTTAPSSESPNPEPITPKSPIPIAASIAASVNLRDPVFAFVKNLSTMHERVVVIYDPLMAYVVQDLDSTALSNAELYCCEIPSAFSLTFQLWDAMGRRPDFFLGEAGSILKQFPSPFEYVHPELVEFVHLQIASAHKIVSGKIYNTNRVIEGPFLDILAQHVAHKGQFAIGPFNPIIDDVGRKNDDGSRIKHRCLDWLDNQQGSAVIFVAFGTTCSLSDEQVREIAIGLENSGHKFMWVLREADRGDIFTGEIRQPLLPDGFEERVKERGIVVRDWAPQLEILGHSSTGGFLTHCGWNSCIESISHGVAMATWPMHADHPTHAVLVTKVLKIGVEVKGSTCRDEIVSASAVENAVRKLMGSGEGEEIRKRAKELGDAVKSSVMEGGVSSKEMDALITHITR